MNNIIEHDEETIRTQQMSSTVRYQLAHPSQTTTIGQNRSVCPQPAQMGGGNNAGPFRPSPVAIAASAKLTGGMVPPCRLTRLYSLCGRQTMNASLDEVQHCDGVVAMDKRDQWAFVPRRACLHEILALKICSRVLEIHVNFLSPLATFFQPLVFMLYELETHMATQQNGAVHEKTEHLALVATGFGSRRLRTALVASGALLATKPASTLRVRELDKRLAQCTISRAAF